MRRFIAPLAMSALIASPVAQAYLGAADHPEEIDRIDESEQPIVRMNPDDPTYDVWKHIRDDISEGREPGPINIQRYYGGMPWAGIPTFFHLPVALTPEDLEAGKVEVAIFGAELIGDMRARSYGPQEMRALAAAARRVLTPGWVGM